MEATTTTKEHTMTTDLHSSEYIRTAPPRITPWTVTRWLARMGVGHRVDALNLIGGYERWGWLDDSRRWRTTETPEQEDAMRDALIAAEEHGWLTIDDSWAVTVTAAGWQMVIDRLTREGDVETAEALIAANR